MHKFSLAFIALITCLVTLNAQPKGPENTVPNLKKVVIVGTVIDNETRQPLEYATISLYSHKEEKIIDGTITDINGAFEIKVPKDIYDIKVEYISYKSYQLKNQNIQSDLNLGMIALELDVAALDAVEVIAERTTVEIKLDKKIYNVGKDLTVSGGSVSDVLDNVPSVSVDAEGNVALRGNGNVRILINGKPSGLVGLNSTEALRQLPAESIEKVEVITSPSARYEAEGTAGILNIILRRSKLQGLNGAVTVNAGHPNSAGVSANINYRTGDLNFFNTTSYNYRESIGHWYNDVSYFDVNTPDLSEKRNWEDTRKGFTTNAGVEWYVNDSASLTSAIVYSNNNNLNNSVNDIVQFDKVNNTTSTSLRLDPEDEEGETIQYSLNFTKDFKTDGHKFTFDFQFEDSDENDYSLINSDGIDSDILTTYEDQENILLQTDYVLPIGEDSQFEMGYRGNFNNRVTDYIVELLNEDTGEFEVNAGLTNVFDFKQHIHAVYTQYGSKYGKFSYLLGLRLENTRTTLDQPTSGDFKKKNLTGLFPTVNLNYEISDDESITLGFNRRLSRPRGFMLNPFPSRSSLTNVFQGNPDLDPTYSGKFELGYLNRFGDFTLSSAIYYQHSKNVITFVSKETGEIVTIKDKETPVVQRGPVNLATDDRYGLEMNLNYSPTRKWRINTDLNFFQLKRDGEFNGKDFGADNFTWSARLTNKLTLPGNIDWQTNMDYRAPSKDTQNNRKGRYAANLAFSKDFFKEKASLAFNIRDLLNSRRFQNEITTDSFTTLQDIQFRGGRTYNVSFTYRFNQKKKPERSGNFRGGDMEM
ncbi:outer membrane beta-barrel family protein [Aestuariivivens insulae]|uniref:outer membrane beta-barrel family protein n=1 Tax=Aestuariivivens insulae TaxID=1621988 RepID=UPI001F58E6C1|nr:outer membrane beta-barrel family protein [Aestuariivivens insulae]